MKPGFQVCRALVASAGVGLFVAACQGPDEYFRGGDLGSGQAGNTPTGAAGSIVSGAAGTTVSGAAGTTGAAGSVATGAAGSIATGTAGTSAGGGAGTSAGGAGGGTAGATGAAGTTGSAGRGGATGAAGSGGRGGTTGTAGSGGRGGSGGGAGRGGTGGNAGSTGGGGRGGTTGAAGATGTAGAGGNSCPAGGRLDCTAAGSLDLTPDGQVVDFSAGEWNNMTARFCDAHGLDGGLSFYAGTGSTAAAAVDTTMRNLRLNLTVVAGGYAGGRINFDSCVDARTFNSIQFTASVTDGSLTGCLWQVQLQTQNQRPTTTNPMGGTCNATTTTCERYPAASLAAATAAATTFTTRFTAFDNPSASTIATASQIVGLQWQVNSGNSGSGTCTVELRIDNIRFVTQ